MHGYIVVIKKSQTYLNNKCMTIFRHLRNKQLYIIEHVIKDIYHTNRNEFAGLYAHPYKHNADIIYFKDVSKIKNMFIEVSNF